MLIVQVLLLLALLAALLILVRRGHTTRTRAFKRLAFVAFLAATVYAILRPRDVTWVANRIGVGRGTDLLLYCLAMAFFAWAVNTYVRFRNLETRFAELVRAVALRNAQPPAAQAVAPASAVAPAVTGPDVPEPQLTDTALTDPELIDADLSAAELAEATWQRAGGPTGTPR
jgi:small membrane protein